MTRQAKRYHLMKNNPEWIARKREAAKRCREKNRDKYNAMTLEWAKRKQAEKLKQKEEARLSLERWKQANNLLVLQSWIATIPSEIAKREQARKTHAEIIAAMSPEKLQRYRESNRIRAREQHYKNQANPEWKKKRDAYFKARNQNEQVRDANRKKARERHREKYKTDAQFVMRHRLRSRIRDAIGANTEKYGSTQELTGCTYEQLRKHIESQFTRGMTWDNQGGWHIDHIIPCAAYDLTKPEQQRACFNWQNLRPLWATENLSKQDKITHPQQHIPLSYA